ncbi:AbgT family transporter [Microbulbifer aggregans]|uniref:AbgT family transporter n=1 Tax=Microbulbifer aggregans TaxID=1769779 RepID=UPI0021F572A7|nr:AbgT family transporter [Microbulbifer aggregans]
MMSYFGLIVSFVTGYKKDLRIGTPIATMIPHSIFFFIGWSAHFFLWVFVAGLPVAPGAATYFSSK